jgi:hypothetical protein
MDATCLAYRKLLTRTQVQLSQNQDGLHLSAIHWFIFSGNLSLCLSNCLSANHKTSGRGGGVCLYVSDVICIWKPAGYRTHVRIRTHDSPCSYILHSSPLAQSCSIQKECRECLPVLELLWPLSASNINLWSVKKGRDVCKLHAIGSTAVVRCQYSVQIQAWNSSKWA